MTLTLTTTKAAQDLGVSPRQVVNLCRAGRLPHHILSIGERTTYAILPYHPDYIAFKKANAGKKKRQPPAPAAVAVLPLEAQFDFEDYRFQLRRGVLLGVRASDRTVLNYVKGVRFFLSYFGEISPENLDRMERYYQDKAIQKGDTRDDYYPTRCQLFNAVLSAAKYQHYKAYENEDYDHSEIVRRIKVKRPKPVNITKRQAVFEPNAIKALIDAAAVCRDFTAYDRILNKALLTVGYLTAFRCNGLCNIRLDDLDFSGHRNNGQPSITTIDKYGKEVTSPFPPDAQAAVREYLTIRKAVDSPYLFIGERGNHLTRDTLSKRMGRLGRKFGLKGFTTHALRRSVATAVAMNGDTLAAQHLLHHAHLNTTQIYLKPSVPRMLARLNTLSLSGG
ncbi:MAG: tyrosine-type recombinase/integrase [Vampirovibrionales bacterium]|nr:tyrosine-type recombinase/integrase [Vampirovibrionales bacterium]